uniref:Uncharacterized protein n=1 Tax=Anguilla anguilla TaxID=7936 RepID=A0A0E9SR64_ANGAN
MVMLYCSAWRCCFSYSGQCFFLFFWVFDVIAH